MRPQEFVQCMMARKNREMVMEVTSLGNTALLSVHRCIAGAHTAVRSETAAVSRSSVGDGTKEGAISSGAL